MRTEREARLLLGLILGVALTGVSSRRAAGAAPQGTSGRASQTKVTLGGTSGTPNDSIVVPLYLTLAPGAEIGELKAEITYVSANLKFASLEVGSDAADAELHSHVEEAKSDRGIDTQTLHLTISAPSRASKKAIPAGLLAYIVMKLSEKARSASITLRGSAEASVSGGKQFQKLPAFEGTVDVFASGVPGSDPLVTCFFFTH
jgi:hypothetical protein